MINLNAIIATFSSEEQQHFIQFLETKNKRSDTKNIQLFKLLAEDEQDSKSICHILYKKDNKPAYHALRKRLYQSLIDFVANQKLADENSADLQLIKYILAARHFLAYKNPKIAYPILDKAELLAQEHQLYPILNEIYHTKIQYAYLHPSVHLETLIDKFRSNQKHYFIEEELNMVYAKIRHTLNNIVYKGEILDFETILKNTLQEHHIEISESLSFKSLYQLTAIVSLSAFVTNDSLKIESFLLDTYEKLKSHKTKDKQLFYHIQVVYIIANTLFRNKKFAASQEYLELMKSLCSQQRHKYKKPFILKYTLLKALNLNYTSEQDQAIMLLESVLQDQHNDIETVLDINLSLVMFYLQKEDLKNAKRISSSFYHTDNYYSEKAGKEWTIKKNLVEIILYIELDELDLVDSRLKSFKRAYITYLKDINQERVITYLHLIEHYYKHPKTVTSQVFNDKVEASFTWVESKQEDIFVMSFFAWLKSKMTSRPLYTVTLELIDQAKSVN